MPARQAFRIYQRSRLLNVNLNVIGAGLLAIALSKPIVWLVAQWIGTEHRFVISLAAAAIDGAMDLAIYYVLHWVANHWRPLSPQADHDHPERHDRFWRNASVVQIQRLMLFPLYYVVAIGGMWALQRQADLQASWAFVWAFIAAILVTRLVHTVVGLRLGLFDRDVQLPEDAEMVGSDAEPYDEPKD